MVFISEPSRLADLTSPSRGAVQNILPRLKQRERKGETGRGRREGGGEERENGGSVRSHYTHTLINKQS